MRLKKDELGRISIPSYFNYVLRKVSLIQSKISLSKYDSDADNYLTESDLKNFIKECIKNFPCLREMPKQFVDIYATTAVRKFSFFLDVHKRGMTIN
jgi:serine/threonine-protein phosphatase 2A regulatory subunit B''